MSTTPRPPESPEIPPAALAPLVDPWANGYAAALTEIAKLLGITEAPSHEEVAQAIAERIEPDGSPARLMGAAASLVDVGSALRRLASAPKGGQS